MFTDEEQKLIKRYAFFSALCPSCLIAAVTEAFVWGILIAISGIAIQDATVIDLWSALLVTMFGGTILCFFIFLVVTARIYSSEAWKDIVEKAQGEHEGDGSEIQWKVLTVPTLSTDDVVGNYNERKIVEKKSGIKCARLLKTAIWTCIIFSAVCVVFSIPINVKAAGDLHVIQGNVAESVEALQESFDKDGMHVSYIGPAQDYRTGKIDPRKIEYSNTGYRVTCYLDYDNDKRTYVALTINNDGDISDVEYYCNLPSGETNEEQYAYAEERLERMHGLLLESKLDYVSPDLENVYLPSERFKEEFMKLDLTSEDAKLHLDYGDCITYRVSSYSSYSDQYTISVDISKPEYTRVI